MLYSDLKMSSLCFFGSLLIFTVGFASGINYKDYGQNVLLIKNKKGSESNKELNIE
jgi:hypothetical protein